MSSCNICLKSLSTRAVKIVCNDCTQPFHGACVNLSREDIEFYVNEGEVWRCEKCGKERRKSMLLETSVNKGAVTLEDVYEMLKVFKEEQKVAEKNLGEAIQYCHNELEIVNKTLASQTEELKSYRENVDKLVQENSEMRKDICQLRIQLEIADQYSRRNCLEVHGIPIVKNEDTLQVVKQVGKALNFEIEDTMIDACHRLGNKSVNGKEPGIIIKFVRNYDKEEMLKRKRVKRELSTRHLGLHSDSAIYVNESLSPARRRLYNAAREVKNRLNFKYIWVRQGKILMRKEDGSSVFAVLCEEDLKQVK